MAVPGPCSGTMVLMRRFLSSMFSSRAAANGAADAPGENASTSNRIRSRVAGRYAITMPSLCWSPTMREISRVRRPLLSS